MRPKVLEFGSAHKPKPSQDESRSAVETPAVAKRLSTLLQKETPQARPRRAPPSTQKKTLHTKPYQPLTRRAVPAVTAIAGAASSDAEPAAKKRHVVVFDLDTARSTRLSLKEFAGPSGRLRQFSDEEYHRYGVREATLAMSCSLARDHVFGPNGVGPAWMRTQLIALGAAEELLSLDWVENHYALIVWKLASMERCFPDKLGGLYLSKDMVLKQLKYRYEREVNRAQRPILRRVTERDDSASRYMVLAVSRVIDLGEDRPEVPDEDEEKAAAALLASFATIELTDGWYRVPAKLDAKLTEHLAMGRLCVGLKLRIYGARLQGATEPCPPLELPSGAFLALSVNGTRRATWDAKLGLHQGLPFPISIRSVKPNGGVIPRMDVVLTRRTPLIWLEKDPATGKWTNHTERVEQQKRAKFQADMERQLQDRQHEVVKAQEAEDAARRARTPKYTRQQLGQLGTDELLHAFLSHGAGVLEALTAEQREAVLEARERIMLQRQEAVQRELAELTDQLIGKRELASFVEVELHDCPLVACVNAAQLGSALVQVFNPPEELLADTLQEGARLTVFGLEPSKWRPEEGERPRLRTGKMTQWMAQPADTPLAAPLLQALYQPRQYVPLASLLPGTTAPGATFDWLGYLLTVAPVEGGDGVWTYFLADGRGDDGDVMALEAPSSVLRFQVGTALQPQMFRNLTYRSFDPRLRVHSVVATVRTELVSKIPEDQLQSAAQCREQVQVVDAKMKLAVSGGLGLPTGGTRVDHECVLPFEFQDKTPELCVAAIVQPVLQVLRTPFGSSCVAAARTAVANASPSDARATPRSTRVLLCLDSGVDTKYCSFGPGCLNTLLCADTAECARLLRWLQVLLRTGVCEGAGAADAAVGRARHGVLCNLKPADLATPGAAVAQLLNAAEVEGDGSSRGGGAGSVSFSADEWRCFVGLLRDALSCKRWEFTLVRRASAAPVHGWAAPQFDVTGVQPALLAPGRSFLAACSAMDALTAAHKNK